MESVDIDQVEFSWVEELFRLGATIAWENPTVVLRKILSHTVAGFKSSSGCLALLGEDGQNLVIVAGVDLPSRLIGHNIRCGEGIIGRVAVSRQPLLLEGDLSKDPRYSAVVEQRDRPRPTSALCLPLQVEQRLMGVVTLNRSAGLSSFTQEDIRRGQAVVNLMTLVVDNARLQARQQQQIHELETLNGRLEDVHTQLAQSEKMAAIGQLAAGVAHEINTPVGYVNSNLYTLHGYLDDLFSLLNAYTELDKLFPDHEAIIAIRDLKQRIDLAYLRGDAGDLLRESQEGVRRMGHIAQDLKQFSHANSVAWQWVDLHQGLDSALNLLRNEIKCKADVVKEYGDLPAVKCIPSQINQVFMNLLVNALQSIESPGLITVRSGVGSAGIWFEVQDNGKGIAPEHISHIFEPFFTTNPVGKGTGLGLSISWNIVSRHGGCFEVKSVPGEGSTFRVCLPRPSTAAGEMAIDQAANR
ncbi:MAG: ATP-binding protein [Pseudomonadota bacterium]